MKCNRNLSYCFSFPLIVVLQQWNSSVFMTGNRIVRLIISVVMIFKNPSSWLKTKEKIIPSVVWNKKDLNRGNEKTLFKIESSSSEEGTFVTKEKCMSAEVFSMFHSLCLTSTAILYILFSKYGFFIWFCISLPCITLYISVIIKKCFWVSTVSSCF